MSEPQPLFHVTKEGKNFTMENCEVIDHGSNRPIIKSEAEGTRVIGTKVVYKLAGAIKRHPIRAAIFSFIAGILATIIGGGILLQIEYTYFVK